MYNGKKIIELFLLTSNFYGSVSTKFILSVEYFADKYHLQKYNTSLTGDEYRKLEDGVYGNYAYNILNWNRMLISKNILELTKNSFILEYAASGKDLISCACFYPIRKHNHDVFTNNERQCIVDAINLCSRYHEYDLTDLLRREPCFSKTKIMDVVEPKLMMEFAPVTQEERQVLYG